MLTSLLLALSLSGSPVVATPLADPVPVLDDDVEVVVDYDLSIDLVDAEIDVDMAVDITYTKPQEQDGNRILRYFMTEWHAFVPSSAEGITVSDPDGPLSYTTDSVEHPGLVLVKVDFRRNLSSGESLALAMSYSLPSEPPPVELGETVELILEDQVVVNDAAVAWAFYSDPRADLWTAEFTLPPGFVEPLDDDVWRRRDGTSVLEASGDEFVYDFVVIENDRAMSETVVPFDGHEITVRYWPDDMAWRDRVSEQITVNLPALIELTGANWPDRPVVVQQSARTLGTSYGGWYTSSDNRITIGRSINPELVLHELSHVWFQYEHLADRWLIEGLADEFAALAGRGPTGGTEPQVSLDDDVAFPLGGWVDPPSIDDTTTARLEAERWAYQAAWHVTRTTRKTIGADAFTDVTRSVLGGTRSYPGPDGSVGADDAAPRTWREFLDLASDHATDEPELAELYAAWVEGWWSDRFEQRSVTRQRYEALRDRFDGVVLPAAVRRPMRDWDFETADEAIDATERFLDHMEPLRGELADRGLSLPYDFDARFARFATADEMTAYRTDVVTAGEDLIRLLDRLDSLDGWQRIGLIGTDVDVTRTSAIDAFTAGDFFQAARQVGDGGSQLDQARRQGVVRMIVACSILPVVLGGFLWLRRRRQADGDGFERRSPTGPDIDLSDQDGYTSSSEEITTSQRS
ncbi:MAG: hypothetical protein OES24_15550 [Acidimicrobiia bacterium]|nr:hypothetical protein [Acidimicrobiia bacterium]